MPTYVLLTMLYPMAGKLSILHFRVNLSTHVRFDSILESLIAQVSISKFNLKYRNNDLMQMNNYKKLIKNYVN